MFVTGLQQHSGRVISLGRAMLAFVFLLAIWIDVSQPTQAPATTYLLLAAYALVSAVVTLATWNNWWLDAKLAAPMHLVDLLMFTLLMFTTEGYTSPFFIFFVFVLLAAAIRWGWRETALTAAALVLLYLPAGLLFVEAVQHFDLQRFIVRTGHMLILSAILIWFGVHQGRVSAIARTGSFAAVAPDESPLESGLLAAMEAARSSKAVLTWREAGAAEGMALSCGDGEMRIVEHVPPPLRAQTMRRPFLYDLRKDRALARGREHRFEFASVGDWVAPGAAGLPLSDGLAVPIQSDGGTGELFLERIDGLSTDALDLGIELSEEIANHFRRHALLKAVEQGGEARARLSLARDLHDSIVQFLAGAAFRIEAMARQSRSGDPIDADLQELKRLMLLEQQDLRSYIGAVRGGHEIELPKVADELRALTRRLADQWSIDCSFEADIEDRTIPMRLNLDAQQLVREAVANAVRHGGATRVGIRLSLDQDHIRLELNDNGRGFPVASMATGADELHPRSLRERVADADGELMVATMANGTSLNITLPVRGRQL